jgi:hypothetical protein
MKKLLPLILFCLVIDHVNAQTNVYHPFPDSNAFWNINYQWYDGQNYYSGNYTLVVPGADTVIGAYTYKIMRHYPAYTYGSGYALPIRQDIPGKKVYVYTGQDELLYDFDLQVGDTIPDSYVAYYFQYITVSSIDSVLIGSQYRKQFHLANTNDASCVLIEGVGSNHGMFEPLYYFERNGVLVYHCGSGQPLYPSSSTWCGLVGAQDPVMNSPLVFPNPASGKFFLTLPPGSSRFVITDLYGRTVMQDENFSGGEVDLDVESGVYFIRCADIPVQRIFIRR